MDLRLLSTIGWTEKVVVEVARILQPEEHVIFYGYANDAEKERVMRAVERARSSLSQPLKMVEVNPMNLRDCIEKMGRYITEDSVANITGGTKIMAFSLALHAALHDIPVLYMTTFEGKQEIKRIPFSLKPTRRSFFHPDNHDSTPVQFLKLLIEKYDGRAELRELRRELKGKGDSTISDAKRKLLRANLIREQKLGRTKIIVANSGAYLFLGGG